MHAVDGPDGRVERREARPAEPARRPGVVDRAAELNQRYAPTLLRLALAAVFVWFGALKLAGSAPCTT